MVAQDFPIEWVSARISDISAKCEQRTPEEIEEFVYVDIGSIDRELKKIATPQSLFGHEAPSRARKVINTGDVLVSLTRPNLNAVALVPDQLNGQIASTGFEVIKPIGVDSRYIFNITRSHHFIDAISGAVQGALYPAAKSSDVQNYKIPLPSAAEQKEISDRLDILLAQVEATQARLARIPDIIKRFRQSVLAAAVSGKLTNSGSKYQTIEVTDTWSHEIEGPIHWLKFNFSDVIKIIGGSQPPKSDFLDEPKAGYVRLIQIRDYKTDAYKVYIPLEKAKRFVSKDDVMIGRYGPPIFQILRGLEGAYNVALMKAEPKPELLDKEYLYWFLQNYKLFNYINAGSDRTAGQSGVNKKHLESYPLLVPPIEEQTEIVRRVEQLFTYADTLEQQAIAAKARVDKLTQAILAKAFRGELTADWRAANPDLISGDNSAEALLARIQAERATAKPRKRASKPAISPTSSGVTQ